MSTKTPQKTLTATFSRLSFIYEGNKLTDYCVCTFCMEVFNWKDKKSLLKYPAEGNMIKMKDSCPNCKQTFQATIEVPS